MPNKPRGGRRGANGAQKAKKATPAADDTQKADHVGKDQSGDPFRWMSAPEILERLLPNLEKLGGVTRGRGKDAVWRKVYLQVLHHCPNITIASKIAGVTPEAVRLARKDTEFAAVEKAAMGAGIDLVEAAAFKSAVYGDLEPVYHQGILVGQTVKYSDAMRALLLKAHKPELYREKMDVEHSGDVKHTHLTLEEFDARYKAAGLLE